MISVYDASSIINLDKGGVLDEALALERSPAIIEGLVYDECRGLPALDAQIDKGRIAKINDSKIDTDLFFRLLSTYDLGNGETECIAIAKNPGYRFVCDDKKARKAATAEIGMDRVTGSIGLLKSLVRGGVISAADAMKAYQLMLKRGAFVPRDLTLEFFQ